MSDGYFLKTVLAHYSEGPLFRKLGLGLGLEMIGLWLGSGLGLVDLRNSGPQSENLLEVGDVTSKKIKTRF